uniref:Centrosomal protein of 68 kDa n=1 Tax=Oryzias sinensis TaxID=183150 RepID=A0A8C7Z8R6_9TELE
MSQLSPLSCFQPQRLLRTHRQMDRNGCSQQSKMQLPRARFRNENTDDRQRDKEEPHKSVTIAATCSYRMDRHYVVRKPLFPAEQHMSTLKMENHGGRSNDFDTREALAPDKCNLSFCDISASPKIKHPSLCFSATGLQAQSCWGKSNSRSPFHDRKSAQSGLPSSFLQVQKVHFPLRPPLTSPVLSPTCNPCLGNSKADQTKVRHCGIELSDWEETKMCSPGTGEDSLASPHQANYWACAIPKAMPPILNRNSADWNPKMDYQALLDYTYPLKPGHMDSDWDSSKQNQDFLPKTFPSLQDSGIELDQLGSSTSSLGQDFSVSDVGQRSPDPQLFPRFSDASPSSFMPSPAGSVNAFLGAVDCCTDTGEGNHHRNDANHHKLNVNSASPGAFTRKVDDEFWLLPEQLEVSGHLCRQVSAAAAPGEGTFYRCYFTDMLAGDHREENSSRNSFDRKGDPAGERLKESRLGEVENLVVQLRSTDLSDCQRNRQVDQEDHHTLMKHIQVFCSHLELLIQQLYAVSQRVEQFSAPTVDLNSIRSSLAEYQVRESIKTEIVTTDCVNKFTILTNKQSLLKGLNIRNTFHI